MESQPTTTISVSRQYDAPAEQVCEAWLDPKQAAKFLFATPTGQMQRVEIDASAGGKFLIVENRNGVDAEHFGEYRAITRPKHIAFTFAVPNVPATLVIIDIAPTSHGCELTLTHEGIWEDFAERTKSGWSGILDSLAKIVGR